MLLIPFLLPLLLAILLSQKPLQILYKSLVVYLVSLSSQLSVIYSLFDDSFLRDLESFVLQHAQVLISCSFITTQQSLLEEQFKDDREWLFDTEQPSLGDISVQMILNTLRFSPPGKRLLDGASFPNTAKWLARVSTFIEGKRASQAAPQPITGDQAAATIMSSAFESYDVVGFDANEAGRLGLKLHDQVQIAPDDTGKDYPTVGKLVAMNREEVVIEVQGAERLLRCHFPQIGFTVRGMQSHKL
ncbi:putative glutathione S-transferase, N-terminal domain [Lyophyllum shimeji]|uniref:Glutathione S-transferase, N-terminal domain n=1 Tax=Lyophyllum shimeji TaxID=47721 RepID=A0A9P3PCW9_LYOSH|nr:putative glutathione S-transferase, N-terminal domain [Lyophyllum shimeji]